MAGKLLPKVYGDKLLHTGADGEGPVEVKLALDRVFLRIQGAQHYLWRAVSGMDVPSAYTAPYPASRG